MFGDNTDITLVSLIAFIAAVVLVVLVHSFYCENSQKDEDCSSEGFEKDQSKKLMHHTHFTHVAHGTHSPYLSHLSHPLHNQIVHSVKKIRRPTRFKYARPEIVTQLYKLMYIIDSVLTKRGIDIWMDGGTFLGAVRHNGIIPWDDDGDFQIWDNDRKKLEQLRPVFEQYGIILTDTWFGYKMYFNDAAPIKGFKWLYPAIDIFPVKLNADNELEFSYPKAQRVFSKCRHDYKTLYPLKRYSFGSFTLNGPTENAIKPYFDRCYGDDWSTHAYQMFDHENEKMMKKVKIVLTPEEKEPAKPVHFDKPDIY